MHKVNAKYKVAWNHTDYATQHPNPKLDRRVYTNVDYVVSVSESCTETFLRMYPAFSQKAVTVENCLARELIERKSLLPAAGMYREAGETVLLSVGRFCEAKNFEAIPKICTVLLKRGLSVKWYILGYGDRETQIREAIQAVHMEDFVVLLGKKENPYCNDQHARRIKPRRLGKLRRKQQIFPCVGGLVLLDDPGRVRAVLDQVPGHDGRFRMGLVRSLAAGDDHGPVRVLLHEFERFIQPLF